MYIGHVRINASDNYEVQELQSHLEGTSQLAYYFASTFQNAEWGKLLGLWHDLGKYSDEFQEYIKVNSGYEEDDQRRPKTDHTSAAAILAKELYPSLFWQPIAYCIAGHHAGLHNWLPELCVSGDLSDRLKKQEFLDKIRLKIPNELLGKINLNPPIGKPIDPKQMHLWVRMLFSCLVDADYLDTERFMNPESFERRGKYNSLLELKGRFDIHIDEMVKNAPITTVNSIRSKILKDCIASGELSPGFFSITVPTGGGKTLSSMAWALVHALKYNKSRIIFAIPYTSIITQTAQIYRSIFGDDNVIEHHSNIDENTNTQERKLAAENWDAPIVVTTNVQLFESLFANKTSRCRKLHNLVNSIIILDEAQMLPPEFLNPILTTLKGLVDNYSISVLFSTATQPALTGKIGGKGQFAFEGIAANSVREIVQDVDELAFDLKRVKIQVPENTNETIEWSTIADELQQQEQVLCIVNTRNQCRELHELMPEGTLHLSRLMCTAHIMDVIDEIKQSLKENKPVRVISTQLIEAGVDIDFPVVYRAIAGLDSIAQCAGRCNREGKLNKENKLGLMKVFVPSKGTPIGLMRKGADTFKELMLNRSDNENALLEPQAFHNYFRLFYSKIDNFDKADIGDSLWKDAQYMKFQFATAARDFRLIDDKGSKTILVEYKESNDLIQLLKRKGPEPWLMRKLQRYAVSINERDFIEIRKSGLIVELHGCWIQDYQKLYNQHSGLQMKGKWLEEINII
ncbi:MAG TPA: CRISPR-associated helicase/endonuclease Cas3 [Prolixibacteraceae bacterium]|nr:CRISPR-associated helicase/endonuclease Cas3 [Prolixibacteraceae bacterium]